MNDQRRSSITVRLGEDLLQSMREAAARNAHSTNAEIVQRLENSLASGRFDLQGIYSQDYDGLLKPGERSLINIWRSLTDPEKQALAILLSKLAPEKSDDDLLNLSETLGNGPKVKRKRRKLSE
ncbi:Arc family DNA-binding protein [Komagataeibacter sp. FNDCR2]|uniref:Arc family DNA-binding protein n=1 Tax=Komagataeibacter sp. FNDCR2 TaxID=2878682 RepID=UPI001E483233|nr:Arc family DNA-binding protein [Komagataeibacter sp. FNDCR2]MCE2574805.1 Arc family DNA-binding protein [Komagataeibacter sp. FNDCR2]